MKAAEKLKTFTTCTKYVRNIIDIGTRGEARFPNPSVLVHNTYRTAHLNYRQVRAVALLLSNTFSSPGDTIPHVHT